MAIAWGVLREQARRTILKDVSIGVTKISNESLLDSLRWALSTLCDHTAAASGVTFTDTTVLEYALPGNLYEPLETSGIVTLSLSGTVSYLNPVRVTESATDGYYVWGDQIVLTSLPSSGSTLNIKYFADYISPINDEDLVYIPQWAEGPVALLLGAYALTGFAVNSSQISQWKEKPEAGQPEHNALRAQANWMIEQYDIWISRYPRQQRQQFYRQAY
jgi:hypothetical protein